MKDIAIYLFTNGTKAVLPFLILPILTLYLSPTDYGLWNIYLAIMSFIMPLTACGLPMIMARNFHKHDKQEHGKMMFTALTCITIFSFIVTTIIAVYGFFYPEFMSIPVGWFLALPLLCLFQNIQYFNKIILVHENRAKFFAIIDLSNVAVLRLGGLIAVIFAAAHWTSLFYANFFVQLVFAALALFLLLKDGRFIPAWNWNRAQNILSMGWPLIGHTIGAIIMTLSDRLILEKMAGTAEVGIYSLGANLGTGVFIFCTAFNQKWGPWLYRQTNDITNEKKTRIVKYTYLYFLVCAFLGLAVTLAAYSYITHLIDPRYISATAYLPWIAAGSTCHGMSLAIAHYVTIEGKTKMLPLVTGTAALLNIILTIWLIILNGPVGAAQATFVSYLYSFIFMWWVNNKTYPMPWKKALSRNAI